MLHVGFGPRVRDETRLRRGILLPRRGENFQSDRTVDRNLDSCVDGPPSTVSELAQDLIRAEPFTDQ